MQEAKKLCVIIFQDLVSGETLSTIYWQTVFRQAFLGRRRARSESDSE